MPLVSASATSAGIELQDRRRALDRADRGMRHQFAEPDRETFLLGVIKMILVAKEDDLVLEQHLVDCTDRFIGQIARQLDVLDLRTEPRRPFDDICTGDDVINRGRLGHDHASPPRSLLMTAPPGTGRGHGGGDETMSETAIYSAATAWGDRQTA